MAKQLQIVYHELPGLTVIAMLSFYHSRSVLSNPFSFLPSTADNKSDVSGYRSQGAYWKATDLALG